MRTSQVGERVQVHYGKRFGDGTVRSSRDRGDMPPAVPGGTPRPRLPGLGPELVGLAAGASVTLTGPAERAYGVPDPDRVRRVSRARFGAGAVLTPGRRVRMQAGRGRVRVVRV